MQCSSITLQVSQKVATCTDAQFKSQSSLGSFEISLSFYFDGSHSRGGKVGVSHKQGVQVKPQTLNVMHINPARRVSTS